MLFEILTTSLMGGIALQAHLQKSGVGNDSKKLNKIFALCGLNVKDGKQTYTTQLVRKINHDWGVEYRYRLPLGRSFEDYVAKQKVIQSGLNSKKTKISLNELKNVKLDKNILSNLKKVKKLSEQKEVELSFDGMLSIKVYNEPLPKKVEWQESFLVPKSLCVAIGTNRNGVIYHDFDKRKHLIVAGATGFGKSVIMKAIITSLVLSQPDHISFSLIDLKGGPAFARFRNLKQVVNFGVDNEEAFGILQDVQQKMVRDYKKIVDQGFEDVTEAGIKERHFLIIDEAADLAGDKDSMEILTDIVRKGRGAGYYIIYATQYPSAQAIPMQIKRNIPARLCFVLDSSTASMTVLDAHGAESLPEIPGRGIYKEVKQTILQTPFMGNDIIKKLISPYVVEKRGGTIEIIKPATRANPIVIEETRLS